MDNLADKRRQIILAFAMLPTCSFKVNAESSRTVSKVIEVPLSPEWFGIQPPILIEFFSYACPTCYEFESNINSLLSLKASKSLIRVPVTFGRRSWTRCAELFHAATKTGEIDLLTPALFSAIHRDGLDYMDDAVLTDWLLALGIEPNRIWKEMRSADVLNLSKRDKVIGEKLGVTSIPSLLVKGKYLVTPEQGLSVMLSEARKLLNE